jgi:hypothetical protein
MAMSRAKALERAEGQVFELENHFNKIARNIDNPGCRTINHWKGEIRSFIQNIEDVIPHMGKKTGAEWATRVAEWKSRLAAIP